LFERAIAKDVSPAFGDIWFAVTDEQQDAVYEGF